MAEHSRPADGMTVERRRQILSLRAEGLSFARIGAQFGVSRQRIEQICNPEAHGRKAALEDAAKVAERIGRKMEREADRLHKQQLYDAYEEYEARAQQAFYIASRIRAKR